MSSEEPLASAIASTTIKDHSNDPDQLKKEILNRGAKIRELEEKIIELEAKYKKEKDNSNISKQDNNNILDDKTKFVEELKSSNLFLQDELNKSKIEIVELTDKLKVSLSKSTSSLEELTKAQDSIIQLEKQVKDLSDIKESNEKLLNDLNIAKNEKELELNNIITDLKSKLEELEKVKTDLDYKLKEITSNIVEFEKIIASNSILINENSTLIQLQKSNINDLKEKQSNLENELTNSKTKIIESESNLSNSNQQIVFLKEQISGLDETVKSLNLTLLAEITAKNELISLKEQLDLNLIEVKENFAKLDASLNITQTELTFNLKTLKATKIELEATTKLLREAEKSITASNERFHGAMGEVKMLSHHKELSSKKIKDLEKEIIALKNSNKVLTESKKTLEAEKAKLQLEIKVKFANKETQRNAVPSEDFVKYKKAAEQLPMLVEKRTKELNDIVEQQNREITLLKEMIRSLKITSLPPGARKNSKIGINVSDKKAIPAFLPPLISPLGSPSNLVNSNNYASPNLLSSPSSFNDMSPPNRKDSLNTFGTRNSSKSNLAVQDENINREDILQMPKSPSNFLVPAPPRKSLAQLPKVFGGRAHSHSKSNLHDDTEMESSQNNCNDFDNHAQEDNKVQDHDHNNNDEYENDKRTLGEDEYNNNEVAAEYETEDPKVNENISNDYVIEDNQPTSAIYNIDINTTNSSNITESRDAILLTNDAIVEETSNIEITKDLVIEEDQYEEPSNEELKPIAESENLINANESNLNDNSEEAVEDESEQLIEENKEAYFEDTN